MLRLYAMIEIVKRHTLRVSKKAEEEIKNERFAASERTDNGENGHGNMIGDLWVNVHESTVLS